MTPSEQLLPRPRRLSPAGGGFDLPHTCRVALPGDWPPRRVALSWLQASLKRAGVVRVTDQCLAGRRPELILEIDRGVGFAAQGYRLCIDSQSMRIQSGCAAGLFYGLMTLLQWVELNLHFNASFDARSDPESGVRSGARLPAVEIHDQPAIAHRGVMLDISRDKVPTLATLQQLADMLARCKVNQLQLYTEHTFAYRGHEQVHRDASPLSAAEVRALDAYCAARCIELVPNQNSFGHFNRWLIHPRYRPLAECPEGIEHPFSDQRQPFSLCPTDPRVVELLSDLYDQLLPQFSSRLFNIGFDETLELGKGRSTQDSGDKPPGEVYLEFLQRVHRLVAARGHRTMFWADMLFSYPNLLGRAPADAIALLWGYEADHPFEQQAAELARHHPFYVCPGTSSWNSLAGRTDNALANLAAAAGAAVAHSAEGYLITDWGDFGHLQPLPVSYLGLLAGAAMAWSGDGRTDLPISGLLDRWAFADDAGVMGRVAFELGNAYRPLGVTAINSSLLFQLLLGRRHRRLDQLTEPGLRAALAHVQQARAPLARAAMRRNDGGLIVAEFEWVADALEVAGELGLARLPHGWERPLGELSPTLRGDLGEKLDDLIARHRTLWLARNRPGGRVDSVGHLMRVRERLRS